MHNSQYIIFSFQISTFDSINLSYLWFNLFRITFETSSEKICADTSRYVEIKIISVKFAPIRGQNNLCQSAKSEVIEISAFLRVFAREKIMDAANHVHINFKFLYVSITFLFVFHRCDRRVSTKFSTFNFQFSVLNLCYPE